MRPGRRSRCEGVRVQLLGHIRFPPSLARRSDGSPFSVPAERPGASPGVRLGRPRLGARVPVQPAPVQAVPVQAAPVQPARPTAPAAAAQSGRGWAARRGQSGPAGAAPGAGGRRASPGVGSRRRPERARARESSRAAALPGPTSARRFQRDCRAR